MDIDSHAVMGIHDYRGFIRFWFTILIRNLKCIFFLYVAIYPENYTSLKSITWYMMTLLVHWAINYNLSYWVNRLNMKTGIKRKEVYYTPCGCPITPRQYHVWYFLWRYYITPNWCKPYTQWLLTECKSEMHKITCDRRNGRNVDYGS